MKQYYVYIMTNKNHTVLYTGVTNDLERRVLEHGAGIGSEFTRRYRVHKLVHFEVTGNVEDAIAREKQIKAGSRKKKLAMINAGNPGWTDLADELKTEVASSSLRDSSQ
jgi:putative endonuclease